MSRAVNTPSTFDNLDVLLAREYKTIIERESENQNRIHLYGIGPYWAAFDKSAYLLEEMLGECGDAVVLRLKDYPFPLMMHSVHFQTVKTLCHNVRMAKQKMDYLQLYGGSIEPNSYQAWFRGNLEE